MRIQLVAASAVLLLVLVFAVQNAEIVQLRLLFWEVEFPRSLLIYLVLLVGVAIGWFLRGALKIRRALR